ncbi:MAG: nucleotidyltransferase domain-containing protein [Candidatus Hydrogenedentota bacterium]|nr:MAG: nucleotidyltransferase domain-containing protein [Candidatus Hydrogenedentota bacterium]
MSVLVYLKQHVLFKLTKEEFMEKLKTELENRVEEAWLFGSITGTKFDPYKSDVDLILVTKTNRPFVERWKDFSDILNLARKIDLLIYTPSEWENLKKETNGFWKDVHKTRIPIIQNGNSNTP